MSNDKFEEQLQSINLIEPTENYLIKGSNALDTLKRSKTSYYWNLALACSLLVSVSVNVWTLTKPEITPPQTTASDDSNNQMTIAQNSLPSYSIEYGISLPRTEHKNMIFVRERKQ